MKQTAHLHLVPRLRAPAEGNVIKTLRTVGLRYLLKKKTDAYNFCSILASVFIRQPPAPKIFKMDVTLSRNFYLCFDEAG